MTPAFAVPTRQSCVVEDGHPTALLRYSRNVAGFDVVDLNPLYSSRMQKVFNSLLCAHQRPT